MIIRTSPPDTPRRLDWRRFLPLAGAGVLCWLLWVLPSDKDAAVDGRLNYTQFILFLLALLFAILCGLSGLQPADRRRTVGLKLAVTTLGLLGGLLLIETICFFLPQHRVMDNPFYLTNQTGVKNATELPFQRPPHLKWTGLSHGDLASLQGVADPYARIITFQTDSDGFRNSQDMDRADVVFIGDSYTEAGNLPEEETFPQLAGKILQVSVRNLGMSGYTAPTELIVLKKYGLKCKPKAVVWQICEANDLSDAVLFKKWVEDGRPDFLKHAPAKTLSRTDVWKQHSPTYSFFAWLRHPPRWHFEGSLHDANGWPHTIRFEEIADDQQHTPSHPGWPILSQAIVEGHELLKKEGIPLVVFVVPKKFRVMGYALDNLYVHDKPFDIRKETKNLVHADWDMPEQQTLAYNLQELCKQKGIQFMDPTMPLRVAAVKGHLVYQPFDTHLSPAGHQLISQMLAQALTAQKIGHEPVK